MNSFSFQVEEIQAKIIETLTLLTQVIGVEPSFNQNHYIDISKHVDYTHEGHKITHINDNKAIDETGVYEYNLLSAFPDLAELASITETMLVHAGEIGAIKQVIKSQDVTAKVSVRVVSYVPANLIAKAPIFGKGDNETVTDIAALEDILDQQGIHPTDYALTILAQKSVESNLCDVYESILFKDEC